MFGVMVTANMASSYQPIPTKSLRAVGAIALYTTILRPPTTSNMVTLGTCRV